MDEADEGGPLMSSMLRIGLATPLFGPAAELALGGLSPISSILLTGDRGVSGEGVRPSPVAFVGALGVFPSSKAKTSLASWSKTDSNDIGYDMMVVNRTFALGGFLAEVRWYSSVPTLRCDGSQGP